MSIGKLINRLKKERNTGVPSLISAIDRTLLEGYGQFNPKEVAKLCREAESLILDFEEDESLRSQMLLKVFEVFFKTVLTYEGSGKTFFHPSSMSEDCLRKLHYDISDTPYSNADNGTISPQLQRIFDIGTIYHAYLQYLLNKGGMLDEIEASVEDKKYRVHGKTDGRLNMVVDGRRVVLEIKTAMSFSFSQAKRAPLKKHIKQASVYAKLSGAEAIYFLYINKDNSEFAEHFHPLNEEDWTSQKNIMTTVINSVEDNKPPHRECSSSNDSQALSCPYRDHCFKLNLKSSNKLKVSKHTTTLKIKIKR